MDETGMYRCTGDTRMIQSDYVNMIRQLLVVLEQEPVSE
jgi:hypothetical protein